MAQIEQVYWKKYLIFFDFWDVWLFTIMSQSRMGPKPTADQKVKNCVKLFHYRKGQVKTDSINVRILKKAKQETREKVKVDK